ncbi:zinc finger protein 484-like [Uranotaenia lowii]|uniref:zinc finger protein 484-like n=1 Tax=Uranotaenia lowii TaxID=190385 RepID=UPI002478939F|nr:zinc finger protein 484-like [Uranotaenia lowii]
METLNIGRRKQKPADPLFEEVVIKEEPIEKHDILIPEPKSTSNQSKRQRTSRHVQVDQEDFYRYVVGAKVKLKADEEPIFLPDSGVADSQCRFCLRKVDKCYLKLIEGALKVKVRSVFKLKVHPYDSYPYVCVNCSNLVHAMFDFQESVIRSKILLRGGKVETCDNGDDWVSSKHVAATDTCRVMVERHRNFIERMYYEYEQKLNGVEYPLVNITEEEGTIHKKDENISKDDESVEPFECMAEILGEDRTPTEENPVQVKVELESSEFNAADSAEENNSGRESNDSVQHDDSDADYRPDLSRKGLSKPVYTSSSEGSDTDGSRKVTQVKRKRGRPKKVASAAKPKAKKERKPYETHFVCNVCGKTLHSASKESHMNQHKGVQPYACPYENCGQKFYSKTNRNRHITRIHNKKVCDICGLTVMNSVDKIKEHMMHHETAEESIACNICGKKFWTHKYMRRHMIIHTDLFPYECQYCGRKFKHKASKDTHEKNMHEKKHDFGSAIGAASSSAVFDNSIV